MYGRSDLIESEPTRRRNYSLYLDRFDIGSLITTHSFNSPYLAKYCRNPSGIENKNKTVTGRPELLGNTLAGPQESTRNILIKYKYKFGAIHGVKVKVYKVTSHEKSDLLWFASLNLQ